MPSVEEAADVDELRLAPEARVDAVRRCLVFLDEAVLPGVPDQVARGTLDLGARQGGDEALVRALEIRAVGEGQLLEQLGSGGLGRGGRVLAQVAGHLGALIGRRRARRRRRGGLPEKLLRRREWSGRKRSSGQKKATTFPTHG
jgi:hypothetical protein